MKKKALTLIISVFLLFSKSYAQESISLEETLKFINAKLAGKIIVDLKGGDVISKAFDEKNRLFRIDKMDTEHINWKGIYFDEDNSLIVIPCDGNSDKCVEREMVLYKEGGEYGRSTLRVEDPVKAAAIIKALQHLVRTVEDHTYKSTEPFE